MSDPELKTFSFEEFHKALFGADKEYIPPFSGRCMFCGNTLVKGVDEDHSICNSCWTDTFACSVCKDETGNCIHRNPEDTEDEEYDGEPYVDV